MAVAGRRRPTTYSRSAAALVLPPAGFGYNVDLSGLLAVDQTEATLTNHALTHRLDDALNRFVVSEG